MNSMLSVMRRRRPVNASLPNPYGGTPDYKSVPQPYKDPRDNSWNEGGQLINRQAEYGNRAQDWGNTANQAYLDRSLNFNAGEAINRYAQGAWGQLKGQFDKNLMSLKGNSVGAGRLDTGFFDEDTGDLYRSTVSDFGDAISRQAVAGAGLDLENNRGLSQFGANQQGEYADMLMSRREEVTNNDREKNERKRKKKRGIAGAIGGVIGGVGGFIASGGNPAGAYAGYKIGRGVAGGG